MTKYHVSDIAKDFGLTNKVVIALLAEYIQPAKKSNTTLTEEELDLLFNLITERNQVESFDAYFATAAEKKPEPVKEEKPVEAKPEAPAAKEEKPAPAPMAGMKQGDNKPKKERSAQPAPSKVKERRTIDTRTPQQLNVNKYDEKFDNMAQTSSRVHRGNENAQRKQKINQKSQQYRRPQHKRETEQERMRRIELEQIGRAHV